MMSDFEITFNGEVIKSFDGTITETNEPMPIMDKASCNWDLVCRNESARVNGCLVAALVNSSRAVWLGGNDRISIEWESLSITVSNGEFSAMVAEMSEGIY